MTIVSGVGLAAAERENISSIFERQWTTAMLARDWDQIVSLCASDIVYMPADQPILEGQAAFRDWLEHFPSLVSFAQPIETIDGQGHMAIARGTFTATVEVAGAHHQMAGKVLCWLQQEAAGRWLVKAVCWNWNAAGGAVA